MIVFIGIINRAHILTSSDVCGEAIDGPPAYTKHPIIFIAFIRTHRQFGVLPMGTAIPRSEAIENQQMGKQ